MTNLYVGNLSFKCNEEEFKKHFESFGKVKESKLMIFRGYSRGFGFIEYETEEDAKKALSANGVEFMGRKLKVEIARPRKERTQEKTQEKPVSSKPKTNAPRSGNKRPNGPRYGQRRFNQGKPYYRKPFNRSQPKPKPSNPEFSENLVFVRNIDYSVKDEDLQKMFEKFNVVSAKVITYRFRGNIRSKGFGFVEVKTTPDQEAAIKELNETEQNGRKIGVLKGYKRPEPEKKE
ncbi:Enhancer binding protein-2 [Entamoeba marina]